MRLTKAERPRPPPVLNRGGLDLSPQIQAPTDQPAYNVSSIDASTTPRLLYGEELYNVRQVA